MNEDNLLRLERAAYKAFKPPEKLTLSEWADRYAFFKRRKQRRKAADGTLCRIKKELWMQ
jgi:hypothetical protein